MQILCFIEGTQESLDLCVCVFVCALVVCVLTPIHHIY
jgi:hypothetical protein